MAKPPITPVPLAEATPPGTEDQGSPEPLGEDPALGPTFNDLSVSRQGTDAPNHVRRHNIARDAITNKFTKGKR